MSQERSGNHLTATPSSSIVVCPFDFLCLKHSVIDTYFQLSLTYNLTPASSVHLIPTPQPLCLPSLRRSAIHLNNSPSLYTGTQPSSAMSSEQAFPESDLRSAAQDYKRDADQKAKWGMGAAFTKGRGDNPMPVKRSKTYVSRHSACLQHAAWRTRH